MFARAATDRATTPRETSEGIVTRTNDVSVPRYSANCSVRSAPGGRSKRRMSSFPQATDARTSPSAANSLVARQVWDSPVPESEALDFAGAHRCEIECLGFRQERADGKNADTVSRFRKREPVDPRHGYGSAKPGHARLSRAVEIGIDDRHLEASRRKSSGQRARHRALPDAALSRSDRHAVLHLRERLRDPVFLVGDLFEDVRAPVPDDVVVGLHQWAAASRSAWAVIAMNSGSPWRAVNAMSSRASCISLARTASYFS